MLVRNWLPASMAFCGNDWNHCPISSSLAFTGSTNVAVKSLTAVAPASPEKKLNRLPAMSASEPIGSSRKPITWPRMGNFSLSQSMPSASLPAADAMPSNTPATVSTTLATAPMYAANPFAAAAAVSSPSPAPSADFLPPSNALPSRFNEPRASPSAENMRSSASIHVSNAPLSERVSVNFFTHSATRLSWSAIFCTRSAATLITAPSSSAEPLAESKRPAADSAMSPAPRKASATSPIASNRPPNAPASCCTAPVSFSAAMNLLHHSTVSAIQSAKSENTVPTYLSTPSMAETIAPSGTRPLNDPAMRSTASVTRLRADSNAVEMVSLNRVIAPVLSSLSYRPVIHLPASENFFFTSVTMPAAASPTLPNWELNLLIAPAMFSTPTASMTFCTALATRFFTFSMAVPMPWVASLACWANEAYLPKPFWLRSMTALLKSSNEYLPSFMASYRSLALWPAPIMASATWLSWPGMAA